MLDCNFSNLEKSRADSQVLAIVIPMYNEADSIPLLSYRLKIVRKVLIDYLRVVFVFVDDGSTDGTFDSLCEKFGRIPDVFVLQHKKNAGFSAALKTGVEHALTLNVDYILTIDADTNYDHFYIPMFMDFFPSDCDIMTASPWHPDGQRKFFPRHRLILSLGLSWCYRTVLRKYKQPLYTYSSCFRIARADVYRLIKWTEPAFMATSEIMAKCVVNGFRVTEVPLQVNPRWFGMSKMRKLKQIAYHLRFLRKLMMNSDAYKVSSPPAQSSFVFANVKRVVQCGLPVEIKKAAN